VKDFISKVTLGFLMAQLLPGAVVIFAITCSVKVELDEITITIPQLFLQAGESWFSSTFKTITFLFMAVATGLLIHGLNWTIWAWLENRACPRKSKPVRESFWHKLPFLAQIFLGPLKMILEILYLLIAPNINQLTLDENAPNIKQEYMQQFLFLQEFYLYFGQFYAHMAYAMLITMFCSLICCIRNFSGGFCSLTVVLYFVTSIFFLLGRIQLSSLFKAEITLKEQSTPTAAGQ